MINKLNIFSPPCSYDNCTLKYAFALMVSSGIHTRNIGLHSTPQVLTKKFISFLGIPCFKPTGCFKHLNITDWYNCINDILIIIYKNRPTAHCHYYIGLNKLEPK